MEFSRNIEISQKLIDFIADHANDDTMALRLKFSGKASAMSKDELDFVLLQIEARRKSRKKIPTFLSHPSFIFPTLISAEQASNEAVARFHASLIPKDAHVLDMTAGLGIDAMTFAESGANVTACELEPVKCDALRHNSQSLGLENHLEVRCGDSTELLEKDGNHYDIIFIDPARRGNAGQRVHALADCQPDVLACMASLRAKGDRILIKASPLLDLTLVRNTVDALHHIYVVCFRGECKEVLIEIGGEYSGTTVVDLDWDTEISRFDISTITPSSTSPTPPRKTAASSYTYLYEPNAGVMKTGAWEAIEARFPNLVKADMNTHLYLSDTLYEDFPGRVLMTAGEPDRKALKRLKGMHLNAVSRNHPLSAPQLESKYGIVAGGDDFLYAFRIHGYPTILLCRHV